jgi:N-acetylglucosamine-6-phosphate deacetylase
VATLISTSCLFTGDDEWGPGWVETDREQVAALGRGQAPRTPDVVLTTGVLAPGLVDAQLNGAYGVDLAGADPAGWQRVAKRLPETGVTSFLPTFITAPLDDLASSVQRYVGCRTALDGLPGAARTLGIHLEGPFLSPRWAGAHPREALIPPTPEAVTRLIDACHDGDGGHGRHGRDTRRGRHDGDGRGALTCMTLAPELPGGLAAIRALTAAGVRVSVGHSDAREDVVHAAAGAGAVLVTHLYNAQRPMTHRDPGVVGAALTDERLTCGLIVDGHHLAPAAIKVAFACATGRIMLVTDAVAALGMPAGSYVLGAEPIVVREDEPPLRRDGTLAGATGRLDDAIGRAVEAGIPLPVAIRAATQVPARALGLDGPGRIRRGGPADLVWLGPLGDRSVRCLASWVAGRLAFRLPGGQLPSTAVLGEPVPAA